MMRPLEWFIGLRYLRTGRGRGLVSFMSLASFFGIGIGVAALIVILSAMNGLETESRSRLLSLSEHITLSTTGTDVDIDELRDRLMTIEGVDSVSSFVSFEAMLSTGARLEPVLIRGIVPDAEGADSELRAVVGNDGLSALAAGSGSMLVGSTLGYYLDVDPGDQITVWRVEAQASRPRPVRLAFTVAGFFEAGAEDLDAGLALTHLADASRAIGLGGEPEGLSIRIDEPMDVAVMQQKLIDETGAGFVWSNWAEENRSLFQAMAIEKTMMTIVLMFIAGIAAFNVVASLTMLVNEKEKDIAILRTMGLARERVMRVFLIQGALIGIGGTLAGVTVGILLALNLESILPWIEQTLGFQIMPGDVYYVTQVPSELQLPDLLIIPGFAIVITLLATVFPSRRAARVEPAEVLRYE